jgi:hypothetical protein
MRSDNPAEIRNVIRTAKAQCTTTDYSNLDQKVKILKIESKILNSEVLKAKIEIFEIKVKSSKFSNTFYSRLQDLKAVQGKKAQDEAATTTTEAPKLETCSALELKVEKIAENFQKVTEMEENVSKFSKDMSTTLKNIESANNHNFAGIMKFIENFDRKIEEKLEGIESKQKNLMEKINKIETDSKANKVEVNQKLWAILNAV